MMNVGRAENDMLRQVIWQDIFCGMEDLKKQ